MSAQNLIAEWALYFFYSFERLLVGVFFKLFLLVLLTVEIA